MHRKKATEPPTLSVRLPRKLQILCGAGVSMIPPTSFPSGNQLRDLCIRSLVSDQRLSRSATSLIKRSAFQAMLPELVLEDVFLAAPTFVDTFMSRSLSNSTPNAVHEAISRQFASVFITNFDLCFEKAGAKVVNH